MNKFLKTKRALLISAGVAVGFAAGSWTPLGELGSLGNITGLALKSDHLSALVGSPEQNNDGAREARIDFQPWLSSVQNLHGSALSTQTQNAMVDTLTSALLNEPSGAAVGEQSLAAALKHQDLGQNAIFADSPNAEISGIIGALEAENQQIALYLQAQSPDEPEYHLTRSLYESNNQWLAVLRFMVQKNNGALSPASISAVTPTLEGLRQRVEESTYLGRQLVLKTMQELIALKTITDEDETFKGLLISFTETYDTSYEIEEMLASLVTDYPGLVAQSLDGHDMSSEIANWDMQTLQLVTERMQLKDYRLDLAMNLSAGPVS